MIHVVGLGIGDLASLSEQAKQVIESCQTVIGSKRQRQLIHKLIPSNAQQLAYPSPLNHLSTLLEQYINKEIVILASGDPLFFGIGEWLSKNIDHNLLCFYTNISSIQIAFSRIKQAWQQARIVSLHGRPLISLRPYLRSSQWYALLTDQQSQPKQIAKELIQQGFTESELWIGEALGTEHEKIHHTSCQQLIKKSETFHPLHVTLVYTQGKSNYLPEFPGIADEHFETGRPAGKGMITKKHIRLAALNLLQTNTNDIAWDIGAGCGGLSVEWAFWHPQSQLYAIECHEERLTYLKVNQEKFGVVQNLNIIAGSAPKAVTSLPNPNRIFIGGSNGAMSEILKHCWQNLQNNGCMVIACVTEDCKYSVRQFIQDNELFDNIEQSQLSISTGETLANKQLFRPQLPVTLIKVSK